MRKNAPPPPAPLSFPPGLPASFPPPAAPPDQHCSGPAGPGGPSLLGPTGPARPLAVPPAPQSPLQASTALAGSAPRCRRMPPTVSSLASVLRRRAPDRPRCYPCAERPLARGAAALRRGARRPEVGRLGAEAVRSAQTREPRVDAGGRAVKQLLPRLAHSQMHRCSAPRRQEATAAAGATQSEAGEPKANPQGIPDSSSSVPPPCRTLASRVERPLSRSSTSRILGRPSGLAPSILRTRSAPGSGRAARP
jgi:hypothetical protein